MKVRELIEKLREMDPEAEVHLAYEYGDHWHTRVAPVIDDVEEAEVVRSDYHEMDRLVRWDEDAPESARTVVVLR